MVKKETGAPRVTQLLQAWSKGDLQARDELLPLVYGELRRRAERYMERERAHHTLRPSDVVHETYLRLARQERADWKNRAQFFGVAAEMMRRVLVDHARENAAAKRGKGWRRVSADVDALGAGEQEVDVLALNEALEDLRRRDPRKEKLVELRFFAGLSIEETAAALNASAATVKREWTFTRAWLYKRLREEEDRSEGDSSCSTDP